MKFEKELNSDIVYILNSTKIVDNMYSDNNNKTFHYVKKLRKITDRFNEKYSGLKSVLVKDSIRIYMKFLILDKTTKDILKNMSNDILSDFSQKVENSFQNDLKGVIALKNNSSWNGVEVLYSERSITDSNCPEFKLLLQHANMHPIKNISIKEADDNIFSYELDDKTKGLIYSNRHTGSINGY